MEQHCGGCRFFRETRTRDDGRLGRCRLEKLMGVIPESTRACPSFSRHGDLNPPVVVDSSRRRSSRRSSSSGGVVIDPVDVPAETIQIALSALDAGALKVHLTANLGESTLVTSRDTGRTWAGGVMHLTPADESLKIKEIALDTFFHKLVMMRDNLRVLEQKINSHSQLHDVEKLEIDRRITVCHGAITRLATQWMLAPGETPAARVLRELTEEVWWSSLTRKVPDMGERWAGGKVRYIVEQNTVEESMQAFYRRLMLLRDQLYALEEIISAHPHVVPDEADSMATYLRRCYGSLTTFNVLIKDRTDYFVSGK
ncbi:MAG: hypothetical protein ACE366_27705 [Bradymonadia bacterium]